MEVITINNIETRPEETLHVEPEVEVRINNQPRQPERPAPSGDISLQDIMRAIVENNKNFELLKEDGKKSRAENQKNVELLNKNIESMKEDNRTLKEDSLRKMESISKNME